MQGRRRVLTGLLLAMTVVAVEVTVVTTALPTVVGELRGLELYPWVFSAYLLLSTVTVPVFGKLADIYGRKPVFLSGLSVFLLGSVLCGLADSMPRLVAFRALQGLGAGAVGPLVFVVIADIYPLRERGKIQGLLSGLWAAASLAGPSLGAFLTLTLSWRWVFFANVPFCFLAAWFVWRYFHENVARRTAAVDYLGGLAFSSGLLALLLATLEFGRGMTGLQAGWAGLLFVAAALLAAFVWIEQHAADPLLPLSLFRLRIFSVASACNLLQGAQLFALTAYIPLYVQGVRGETAAGAGAVLTPLLLAWSLCAMAGPRLVLRFGLRRTALLATGLIFIGSLPLLFLDEATPAGWLVLSMLVMGSGFGPSTIVFVVALQAAVSWEQRGAATSSTQLFRTLGGTIGIALLGAVLNSRLLVDLPVGEGDGAALLNAAARASLSAERLAQLQTVLVDALRPVFGALVALALVSLAVVLRYARNEPGLAGEPPSTPPAPERTQA